MLDQGNDSGPSLEELSKQEFTWLSERLKAHREKLDGLALRTISSYEFIGAPTSQSGRKYEDRYISRAEEQQAIKQLEDDLEKHINVLKIFHVRDWKLKTLVLRYRYVECLEWDAVCLKIFGDCPDYRQHIASYRRRMYRLHRTALVASFKLFGRGKQ